MIRRLFPVFPARQNPRRALFLILFVCLCHPLAEAAGPGQERQTEAARPLLAGEQLSRELSSGQIHAYKIQLAAGSYLRLFLSSQDMRLETRLLDLDGASDIGVLHLPLERELRYISLIAEASGEYRLEIYPAEKAPPGHYEVKIEALHPASGEDRIRLAAEKVEHQGTALLHYNNTAEQRRQGIKKYQEALALWQQLGDNKGKLRMLAYIDIQYRGLGEPQTALKYRQQAIEIARLIGDRYQEGNLIIGFGVLHQSLGEHQKALASFEQARQLFRKQSARYGEATAVHNLALSHMALGEWETALQYLNEALPTYSAVGSRSGEASVLNSIGSIHRELGEIQKAIDFHNRALTLSRADGPLDSQVPALGNLGNDYLALGDRQRALDFFEQSLQQSRTMGVRVFEGDMLKRIGDVAYLAADYGKAIDHLNQALEVYRSVWERNKIAKTLHSLAQVNYTLGNFEEAKKQLELVLEIQETVRTNIVSPQSRESFFISAQNSFALYIDVLMQLHRKDSAAGYDLVALQHRKDSAAGYDLVALQASEQARARSLLDLLAESRAGIRQGVPQELLELERSLQQQLNAKAAARTRMLSAPRSQSQLNFFDKEIAELTGRFHEVEARIRQSSPRYAALTQPQPLSPPQIQQQLDDNTLLLEFALGDSRSWLWAVTGSSINSYPLPPGSQIESAARTVHQLLVARQPARGESEAQYQARVAAADRQSASQFAALSQMLLGPIAAKLQSEWRGKRLAIVASGALEYVPFAILPLPTLESSTDPDYRPLIARHEIVNLPSASVLALIRSETAGRKPAQHQVAVIADPVFELNDSRLLKATKNSPADPQLALRRRSVNQHSLAATDRPAPLTDKTQLNLALQSFTSLNPRAGFARLPFSRLEAEAIVSLARKSSLLKATDFHANRLLATNGELARFRIVHFATHGLLNSQHPELSGLVLSLVDPQGKPQDGFLRMHEIYNLQLPADLIVLSACQTALGKQIKGEGLVGLTRGFMYAGARRVVASLWQVDDLATAELMKSFYRGMLKEGLAPAAALRAAQLEMLKQKRWSSPFFWAAFTIQGEWL
jgi:CHAT domain-containing protein/tetratricopeptide (TPR) repeat protein